MTPTTPLISDFTKFFSIQPTVNKKKNAEMLLKTIFNIKQLQYPRYGLTLSYIDTNNHYHQMMAIFDQTIVNNNNTQLRKWFNNTNPTTKPLTTAQFIILISSAVELPF